MKTLKSKLAYLAAIGLSVFLLFFFITNVWIGHEVKSLCQAAEQEYSGDCVQALLAQLEDEDRSFASRNKAIWALGQLGDRRALATLEKYYTGHIPEREPLNQTISQYELKKAINLAGGGLNISAWLWR